MRKILYVGMDVHSECTVIAVIDAGGKQLMQNVLQTDASVILDFLRCLGGEVHVTFEEGTQAQWLFDQIYGQVKRVVVCDPRQNSLLKDGNKNDRVDALKLAQLLRNGMLHSVCHADHATRTLKELVRGYERLVQDSVRAKNRIRSIFRARGIRCRAREIYRPGQRRAAWLEKLEDEAGARSRAERLCRELDAIEALRREACREMIRESRQHKAHALLMTIPELGAKRVAQILAIVDNPQRFRTKRQFWTYVGLAVVTKTSSDYEIEQGRIKRRKKKVIETRGLNANYNRRLKNVFKSAATKACHRKEGVYREWYERLVSRGMREEMARLTVARKLSATTLRIWKSGEVFDGRRVMMTASAAA